MQQTEEVLQGGWEATTNAISVVEDILADVQLQMYLKQLDTHSKGFVLKRIFQEWTKVNLCVMMKPDQRLDDCHLEENEEPQNIGDDSYMCKEETFKRVIVPP